MLGKDSIRALTQQVLVRCGDYPAEVMVTTDDQALTRFANNTIHQNVAERNINLTIQIFDGKKRGTATTNRIDPDGLDAFVEKATAAARVSPEDPESPGIAEPAEYQAVRSFDEETAAYEPESRAVAVGIVCRLAEEKELNASGAFATGTSEIALANTKGLFAYHPRTNSDFQVVVMGEDSSGRAQRSHWQVNKLNPEALGQEAIEKAERGSGPKEVKPGEYTVVLDPYATQDIVSWLNFSGVSAQAVQEQRSWMATRLGQKAMSPEVNIWDDGLDPAGFPMPFDFEGVPKQRVDIVKDGVVIGPVYDRKSAKKEGKTSTGHGLPPNMRFFSGSIAGNLFMGAGRKTTDEMIQETERGLYITRFFYTRLVHPPDCVITGMTRDGVFMIENGKLTYPVKNLRFTQSYVNALAGVAGLGCETRLLLNQFGGFGMWVPALKLDKFNFTSSTV